MKVALLTSNFPPEIHAGTEMVVVALAHALSRLGHQPLVLTSSEKVHSGEDLRRETYEGIPVWRAFKHLDEWDQNRLDRPRLCRIMSAVLDEQRPDVLHVHSFSQLGAGVTQAARRSGLASVMTFHDVWATCPRFFRAPPEGHGIVCPSGSSRDVCVRCCNLELRHPDLDVVKSALSGRDLSVRREIEAAQVLTAPTVTAAQTIRDCLPCPRPIETIPHGLLRPLPADERSKGRQPGEPLRIGSYGNLVEPKGVLELVRAAAGIDCELHLSGAFLDPAFEQQTRRMAAEHNVRLVYHGPYDPTMPHPALRLHLAVFPSKCQETYGLVVDEALARSVPCVVSDRGALVERARHGGVVVTPIEGLGQVLRQLAGDPQAIPGLRASVPPDLGSIDAAARRYVELYEQAQRQA